MMSRLLKSFSASERGVWMPGGHGDYWAHGCLTHVHFIRFQSDGFNMENIQLRPKIRCGLCGSEVRERLAS